MFCDCGGTIPWECNSKIWISWSLYVFRFRFGSSVLDSKIFVQMAKLILALAYADTEVKASMCHTETIQTLFSAIQQGSEHLQLIVLMAVKRLSTDPAMLKNLEVTSLCQNKTQIFPAYCPFAHQKCIWKDMLHYYAIFQILEITFILEYYSLAALEKSVSTYNLLALNCDSKFPHVLFKQFRIRWNSCYL